MLISTDCVTKIYGSDDNKIVALNNVTMSVNSSEMVAITGESGSGKSTLLHILGGIDYPTEGKVIYDENILDNYNSGKVEEYRNRYVGFVFQDFKLIPELYVRENILFPAMIGKKKYNKKYFSEITDYLGIHDVQNKYPENLSGGQQQRVAIARALINQPSLLLCDEPTGNLDKKNSENVFLLLKMIREKYGTTIIIVTHDPNISSRCDRSIKLLDGCIFE